MFGDTTAADPATIVLVALDGQQASTSLDSSAAKASATKDTHESSPLLPLNFTF